jgi:multimeric flavodoxin WrbA
MKTLIACYSRSGNTLKAAEALKAKTGAEITIIEPVKPRNIVGLYLFGSLDARNDRGTPIKPCITDLKGYDAVVFCTPVYAGSSPAPMNQYLKEIKNYRGKKYGIVITSGGMRKQNASLRIKAFLDRAQGQFLDIVHVTEEQVKKGEFAAQVEALAKKLA